MINHYLKPDPNVSNDLAEILAVMHETIMATCATLKSLSASDNIVLSADSVGLEARIEKHVEALVQLGRPRVALDCAARGWELEGQQWRRPLRPQEDPTFPHATVAPPYDVDTRYVYAEHNKHARFLDGIIELRYGLDYDAPYYVS